MAGASGQPCARLIDGLLSNPESFELFEAARMIELESARAARADKRELPPEIGSQDKGAGGGDAVRFRSAATLRFPGAAISAPHQDAGPGDKATQAPPWPIQLEVSSFGLIGPAGVLPRHYTVLVCERLRRGKRDTTLRDFLEIFSHRATSLLFRAWAKYRPLVQQARVASRGASAAGNERTPARDPFSDVLACLIGLGGDSLRVRLRVDEHALFTYAGHLSRQPAAVLPLVNLIEDFFRVKARIDQFQGRWLDLEPEDQTQLGVCNSSLGVSALAGRRVWSVESAYRVRIGPLSLAEFRQWLPGGENLDSLGELLLFHVGPTLEAAICPVLQAAEVPQTQLGGPSATQLGWTSWLVGKSRPLSDAEDACFLVTL